MRGSEGSGVSAHPCVITLEVSELCVLKGKSKEPLTGYGEKSRDQWGDKIDDCASKTLRPQARNLQIYVLLLLFEIIFVSVCGEAHGHAVPSEARREHGVPWSCSCR